MSNVYEEMVKGANIPTTEAEINAVWQAKNAEESVQIANDSRYSPFWRLISSCVTTPSKWLIELMIKSVLPNAFLRDATGPYLEMLAWAVNVERKPATKTAGVLLFVKEDDQAEITAEAGLFISTRPINGRVHRVVVKETTVLGVGVASGEVEVEAEIAGIAHNLGADYFTIMVEPIDGIESVTNGADWISVEGAEAERDEALRLRCRNQFSAVGQYHHDAAYRADICLFAGIDPNYVWFEHGAPRGAGSANAYVMIDSGAPAQSFVDSINEYIQTKGNHGHGDDMLVLAMPETEIDVEITCYHESYLSQADIDALQAEVENITRYAFRENQDYDESVTRTMPWARYSFSRLADQLHQRLPNLKSVAFDRGDYVSEMELGVIGTLTVTMEVG